MHRFIARKKSNAEGSTLAKQENLSIQTGLRSSLLADTPNQQMRYQPRLDAVRGICIAAVFLSHTGFLLCGWVGVQAFFVLSGYLITDILLRAKDSGVGAVGYFQNFYARRALRIFPVYFTYLAVVFLADYLISSPWIADTEPPHSAQNAPYLLTYTYNLYHATGWAADRSIYFAHLWSLSIEEQFYLLWPLVVFVIGRRALLFVCLVLIGAGPLVRLLEAWWQWNPGPNARILVGGFVYFLTPSHADAFAFGAVLNLVRDRRSSERTFELVARFVRPGVPAIGLWMLLLSFLAGWNFRASTLGWPVPLPYFFAFVWGYTLLNAWAMFAIDRFRHHKSLMADNRFLQRLGRVSYGFYIFHFPAIWLVRLVTGIPSTLGWQRLWQSCVAFLITWALAEVSFRYLETPFLRLKARFEHVESAANRPDVTNVITETRI